MIHHTEKIITKQKNPRHHLTVSGICVICYFALCKGAGWLQIGVYWSALRFITTIATTAARDAHSANGQMLFMSPVSGTFGGGVTDGGVGVGVAEGGGVVLDVFVKLIAVTGVLVSPSTIEITGSETDRA